LHNINLLFIWQLNSSTVFIMKLSAAAVVFTLATLVAGSPIAVSTKTASTNSVDGSIEKRSSTTGGLYPCTNDNFGGHCEHLSMTFDKCCESPVKETKDQMQADTDQSR